MRHQHAENHQWHTQRQSQHQHRIAQQAAKMRLFALRLAFIAAVIIPDGLGV
jgi:hypothetical protein